jgi:serine/threonine protein kinase
MNEAKILASLKNTVGIVDVIDFFNTNKTSYIVMEHLDGLSLKNYHKRQGNLTLEQLYTLLAPIFDGLQVVHSKGLIHRDISPDNIIIDSQNNAKLIDFGASKRVNYTENSSMSIVLKHGFAPEEQYRKHGEQGPWSDVYALASTIYYCMVGKLPPESVQRLYKDNITNPSSMGISIDKAQELVLMRALSVYAKNRYQTVLEFKQALSKSMPRQQVVVPQLDTKDTTVAPVISSRPRTNFYQNLLGHKKNKSK